jgi:hypothetical protein
MKATLKQVLESQNELSRLYGLSLPPKVKYWVGRIQNKAQAIAKEFMAMHNQRITDQGEQIVMELIPAVGGVEATETEPAVAAIPARQEWRVVAEGEDVSTKQTQYRIKAEDTEAFNAATEEIVSSEVEIPFDAINISDLGDVKIEFDLMKLDWMLAE